jgi:hypothetical protein
VTTGAAFPSQTWIDIYWATFAALVALVFGLVALAYYASRAQNPRARRHRRARRKVIRFPSPRRRALQARILRLGAALLGETPLPARPRARSGRRRYRIS